MIDNFFRYLSNLCPLLGNLDARTDLTVGINRWNRRGLSFSRTLDMLPPTFQIVACFTQESQIFMPGFAVKIWVLLLSQTADPGSETVAIWIDCQNRIWNANCSICTPDGFTNRRWVLLHCLLTSHIFSEMFMDRKLRFSHRKTHHMIWWCHISPFIAGREVGKSQCKLFHIERVVNYNCALLICEILAEFIWTYPKKQIIKFPLTKPRNDRTKDLRGWISCHSMRNQLLTNFYEPDALAVMPVCGDPSQDFGQGTHHWQKQVCRSLAH
jgi:hypothetical protein